MRRLVWSLCLAAAAGCDADEVVDQPDAAEPWDGVVRFHLQMSLKQGGSLVLDGVDAGASLVRDYEFASESDLVAWAGFSVFATPLGGSQATLVDVGSICGHFAEVSGLREERVAYTLYSDAAGNYTSTDLHAVCTDADGETYYDNEGGE